MYAKVLPIDGIFVERCICSLLIKDLISCDSGASAALQSKPWMECTPSTIHPGLFHVIATAAPFWQEIVATLLLFRSSFFRGHICSLLIKDLIRCDKPQSRHIPNKIPEAVRKYCPRDFYLRCTTSHHSYNKSGLWANEVCIWHLMNLGSLE